MKGCAAEDQEVAVAVVEGAKFEVHLVPSWSWDYQSYFAVDLGDVAFDVGRSDATSANLAGKSWMGDVAAVVVGEAHMKVVLAVAMGIVAEEPHSTSASSAGAVKSARHTFCADRVPREMQPKMESLIAEYGTLEGMVATSALLP